LNIKNYPGLLTSLHELDGMIEMDHVKESIVSQIKFLLVNSSHDLNINKNEWSFDGHMLHTVIYGPPGVGKTKICYILAKIWSSLGLLDKLPAYKNKEGFVREIGNLNNEIKPLDKLKNSTIDNLQNKIKILKDSMKLFSLSLQTTKYNLNRIKREIEDSSISQIKKRNIHNKIGKSIKSVDECKNFLKEQSEKSIKDENIQFSVKVVNLDKNPVKPTMNIINNHGRSKSLDSIPEFKPKNSKEPIVKIVSRPDFVGGYLGQTAIKTEKLLNDSLGKVLFIDEAYSLVNDEKDSYGKEALTVLNKFMSEHSSEIVIIFAGYKDLIEKTIFRFQPGLKRRCTWVFEVEGYSGTGLSKIFLKQLKEDGWYIDEDISIEKFFDRHLDYFTAYGGDTLRLVFYCKICYSEKVFNYNLMNNRTITLDILEKALIYLKDHKIKDDTEKINYPHIYI